LHLNTTGYSNTAIGVSSLYKNTTGYSNNAVGSSVLFNNTTGNDNTANGDGSLYNLTGAYSDNTAMGFNAGRSWADGTTALTSASQSVYIGSGAMGYNNSDVNSIVIGYLAKGIGANSVVLGNDSIITTALKGSVGIGTTTPDAILNIFGTTSTLLRIATSTNQGILVIGADGNASFGGTITSNSLLGGATNLTVDANGTIIRDTSDINLKEGI
jgi:hypothetical protein